jgi:predicted nucleic acid-binding protein
MAENAFLDTNMILDHLADRQPFAEYAHRIFALAETGRLTISVSSLSICNLHYLLRKLVGNEQALTLLRNLTQLTRITTVGHSEIISALGAGFKDFEDAVQTYSAEAGKSHSAIVTRNKNDFVAGNIPIMTPEEFLSQFEKKNG